MMMTMEKMMIQMDLIVVQIKLIIVCQERIICAQNAFDIFHHVHIIASLVNNALLNEIIIVFGWIAVSVNQITNYTYWDVHWQCLHYFSVPIYR